MFQSCNKAYYKSCRYYDIMNVVIQNYTTSELDKYMYDTNIIGLMSNGHVCNIECDECITDTANISLQTAMKLYPRYAQMKMYYDNHSQKCSDHSESETRAIVSLSLCIFGACAIIGLFLFWKFLGQKQNSKYKTLSRVDSFSQL